ncbi:MAG: ABC transporter substrate-binding protein [Albidovulum sp.]|nr:ABC transporter substrate-binding protein [Albidovulum sp.]
MKTDVFANRAMALVSGFFLAATGVAGLPAVAVAEDDPLIVNMAQAPATLDPAWGCGIVEVGFVQNFYVRLTQYGSKPGPDGTTEIDVSKIEPYLATSWEISDDGLVYTYQLRDDVKFASGRPVTAEDVKYSWERVLTMNGCGAFVILDGFYDPPLIAALETPDPYTLVVKLSRPDPNLLQLHAQPWTSVVDRDVVEANGGIQANSLNEWMSANVTGPGPFILEEYLPNERAVLVANPDFPIQPASSKIIISFINSDPTLLLQARGGEADVTLGMTKASVASLSDNPDVRIIANDHAISEQIGLPNTKSPWDNVKVREAVSYAVPYEEILESAAFGYGTLFGGPFMPTLGEFTEGLIDIPTFDMDKAMSLMAESGVATPIDVDLNIPEGNTIEEQIATIIQATWRPLGINVNINKLSATDYIDSLQAHTAQTYIRLDGPGVPEAGYFLGYDMTCGLQFNLTEVCLEDAQMLLEEARGTIDDAKRQALYDEIARIWSANTPKIHVYSDKHTTVLSSRVTDYHFNYEMDFRLWAKN